MHALPNPTSFGEQTRTAANINLYWSKKGFDARATVVGSDSKGWRVSSALVNGLPPEALDVATLAERTRTSKRRMVLRDKGHDFVTGEAR